MARTVARRRPLPDIADQVMRPQRVGPVAPDRRGTGVPIAGQIVDRERPLPCVGGIGRGLLALSGAATFAALRGIFELLLGRQACALPSGIGFGIVERDVDDRVVLALCDGAALTFGMAPVRAADDPPPLRGRAPDAARAVAW